MSHASAEGGQTDPRMLLLVAAQIANGHLVSAHLLHLLMGGASISQDALALESLHGGDLQLD